MTQQPQNLNILYLVLIFKQQKWQKVQEYCGKQNKKWVTLAVLKIKLSTWRVQINSIGSPTFPLRTASNKNQIGEYVN